MLRSTFPLCFYSKCGIILGFSCLKFGAFVSLLIMGSSSEGSSTPPTARVTPVVVEESPVEEIEDRSLVRRSRRVRQEPIIEPTPLIDDFEAIIVDSVRYCIL